MWRTRTTIAPTEEPITIVEARRQCRIEADDTTFDADLTGYIVAARVWIEGFCGIKLCDQQLELRTDSWSDLRRLPIAPIQAVESISYETGGVATDYTDYRTSLDGLYPAIGWGTEWRWPSSDRGAQIVVTVAAGFGDAAMVPADIKQVAKMLVSSMFDNRGTFAADVLDTARLLLQAAGRCRLAI